MKNAWTALAAVRLHRVGMPVKRGRANARKRAGANARIRMATVARNGRLRLLVRVLACVEMATASKRPQRVRIFVFLERANAWKRAGASARIRMATVAWNGRLRPLARVGKNASPDNALPRAPMLALKGQNNAKVRVCKRVAILTATAVQNGAAIQYANSVAKIARVCPIQTAGFPRVPAPIARP